MKTKKLWSLIVVLAMMLSLAACGGSSDSADSADDGASDEGKVYKIGMCQQMEHEALDAASQGFMDACTELFGEGNVVFDEKNAQGEQAQCSTIINQFISDDVDLILANATLPLQVAASATSEIPILGTSVTDYATALGISDWTGITGVNISGTCDLTPLAELEDMLLELFPDVKQVGIVYCSGEPNSEYQANVFAEALDEDSIAWKEFTAVDSNDLASVVTAAIAECDVLWIPTDNLCAQYTDIVNNVCEPAGVPVIASEPGMCAGFGVAALGIEYYDIGYRAGEMAYDILVNGEDVSAMPIETAAKYSKICTPSRAELLGITLPEDYVSVED